MTNKCGFGGGGADTCRETALLIKSQQSHLPVHITNQKMASSLKKILELNEDLKELTILNDGINWVKNVIHIGENMMPKGYNVMDLVHKWIKSEIPKLKDDLDNLTSINII